MQNIWFFPIFIITLASDDIDFNDIVNYDPIKKQYHKPDIKKSLEKEEGNFTPQIFVDKEEKKCLFYLTKYLSSLFNLINKSKCKTLNKYKRCELKLVFTEYHVKTLERFLENRNSTELKMDKYSIIVPEIFDTLVSMLPSSKGPLIPNYINFKARFTEILGMSLETLIFVLLAFVFAFQVSLILKRSLLLFFFKFSFAVSLLSFPWTWFHLYQEALAKRRTEISTAYNCDNWREEDAAGSSVGFFSRIGQFLSTFYWVPSVKTPYAQMSSRERCLQYQRAIHMDPFWEVPPSKAVAVTLTKFILEPLHHLGSAFNTLILSSFSNFPIHYALGVMCLLTFLSVTCMLMLFSYRLRLPFFLGTLEPSPTPRQPISSGSARNQGLGKAIRHQSFLSLEETASGNESYDDGSLYYSPIVSTRKPTKNVKNRVSFTPRLDHHLTRNVSVTSSTKTKGYLNSMIGNVKNYFSPTALHFPVLPTLLETNNKIDSATNHNFDHRKMSSNSKFGGAGDASTYTPRPTVVPPQSTSFSTIKVSKRRSTHKRQESSSPFHQLTMRRIHSVDQKVSSLVDLLKQQREPKPRPNIPPRHFTTLPDLIDLRNEGESNLSLPDARNENLMDDDDSIQLVDFYEGGLKFNAEKKSRALEKTPSKSKPREPLKKKKSKFGGSLPTLI